MRWLRAALDVEGVDQFRLRARHKETHFAAEIVVAAPPHERSMVLSGMFNTDATDRARMHNEIGRADRVRPERIHPIRMSSPMKSMLSPCDAELVQAETPGAVSAMDGRVQAHGAMLARDFTAVLAGLTCPDHIVISADGPLGFMPEKCAAAHPHIPFALIPSAGVTAPERQPQCYAAAAFAFADSFDATPKMPCHNRPPVRTDPHQNWP